MWEISLQIYRKLAAINPAQFDLSVAGVLMSMGLAHLEDRKSSQGKQEIQEVEQLALKYPDDPFSTELLETIKQLHLGI